MQVQNKLRSTEIYPKLAALTPFSCKNVLDTKMREEVEETRKRIDDAVRGARSKQFSEMGTWRIVKKTTNDG